MSRMLSKTKSYHAKWTKVDEWGVNGKCLYEIGRGRGGRCQ